MQKHHSNSGRRLFGLVQNQYSGHRIREKRSKFSSIILELHLTLSITYVDASQKDCRIMSAMSYCKAFRPASIGKKMFSLFGRNRVKLNKKSLPTFCIRINLSLEKFKIMSNNATHETAPMQRLIKSQVWQGKRGMKTSEILVQ